MKRYIKILAFLFMIGLVACEYNYIPEEVIDLPDPDPNNPISFETQIEPIFKSKCIGCHSTRTPILTTGVAYDNLIDGNFINTTTPEDSEIYDKAKDDHSNNKFDGAELTLLLTWIIEGAEDN